MADTFKIPTPADLLKAVQPRTGTPAPNMGGTPRQSLPAQRTNIARQPAINSGPPGPAPSPLPPAAPTARPSAGPAGPAAPLTYFPGGPLLPGQVGPTGQVMPETGHIQPGSAGGAPAAPTFNFNFGAPATQAPQQAGGEMWPDAQTAPGAPTPTTNAGGEMWPDARAPKPGEVWPDAQAPPVAAPYKVTSTFAHVPRRFEIEHLAPGEGVTTPIGDVYHDPATGKKRLKLNEAGKVAWRQKEQERLKAFGTYPMSHDPAAPTPDVTPGLPVFNAFAGKWL